MDVSCNDRENFLKAQLSETAIRRPHVSVPLACVGQASIRLRWADQLSCGPPAFGANARST